MHAKSQPRTRFNVVEEHRCLRCGNQYLRSTISLSGESFDLDPFTNFKKTQRSLAEPTAYLVVENTNSKY